VTSLLDGPVETADVPRSIEAGLPASDHVFRGVARSIGIFVLVLTGAIGAFLGYQLVPTLHHYGVAFFTGDS
jgi:phosphate transport system permease protein